MTAQIPVQPSLGDLPVGQHNDKLGMMMIESDKSLSAVIDILIERGAIGSKFGFIMGDTLLLLKVGEITLGEYDYSTLKPKLIEDSVKTFKTVFLYAYSRDAEAFKCFGEKLSDAMDYCYRKLSLRCNTYNDGVNLYEDNDAINLALTVLRDSVNLSDKS